MEEDKSIDVLFARVNRHEAALSDHDKRVRDIELKQSADYQWRTQTDKTLATINAKLEALLSADSKTYNTIKVTILTAVISSIAGYVVAHFVH